MFEVVLGVTGSISAYKAAELVRLMMKRGWGVSVVMTDAATKFVTPLTFQTLSRRQVAIDSFSSLGEWEPNHIALAKRADALVIAPCTANVLAKLACGIADDELSATAIACRAPLIVAPAMNDAMLEHPATQANLETLRKRGAVIVSPEIGELACGVQGRGRLADLSAIIEAIEGVAPKL
jgi:phosphopantothenoylcysteine decarboxylase/phosphopantothenate--cysteine ligase